MGCAKMTGQTPCPSAGDTYDERQLNKSDLRLKIPDNIEEQQIG